MLSNDILLTKELKDLFGTTNLSKVNLTETTPNYIEYVSTQGDGNCGYHAIRNGNAMLNLLKNRCKIYGKYNC